VLIGNSVLFLFFLDIHCHESLNPSVHSAPADKDLSANEYVHMLWKTGCLCMQLCTYLNSQRQH
jgi:hypothetical protein